jgi:ATP-dependent DNA ligase
MSYHVKLVQKAKTGGTKWTIVESTDDGKLITRWGLIGSDKSQEVIKECQPKNVGRSNETSAADQAEKEARAKVKEKTDNGYVEVDSLENIKDTPELEHVGTGIDLDNIPKSFCPCKPISQNKLPKSIEDGKDTYAQRKRDGHCLVLVKTTNNRKVYTRTMEDITFYSKDLPTVKSALDKMPNDSMVVGEFVFTDADGRDRPRIAAKVIRKADANEAMQRYVEYSNSGKFSFVPFDIMFFDGNFIGERDYIERYNLLVQAKMADLPSIYYNWKDLIEEAKEKKWEGFVLRTKGEKSHIRFTLNGKADRAGSYKYKFLKTDEFVIVRGEKGMSGWQSEVYATFYIGQYYNGKLTEFGKCGLGTTSQEDAVAITKDIDSGRLKFGEMVVEIEFQDRQEDSGKLQFPQIQRVRYDKTAAECTCEDEFTDV